MKTDRLYALTLYLFNHGKSSASELAKHFEVSVRTIQRDIDALCQAGIPICAFTGTNGGYEILNDFKMNNQLASEDEYAYIATAINGLKSVTNNPMAEDILNDCDNAYKGKDISTKVRLSCHGNAIYRIKEYLNGQLIESFEDGTAIIIPKTKEMFVCEIIATKAIPIAKERIKALEHMGFCLSEEFVIGHDGTKYGYYYVQEV